MNAEMYSHLLNTIKSLRISLHEKIDGLTDELTKFRSSHHAILNEIEKTVTEAAKRKSRAQSWQEWEINQEQNHANYD